jgi:hypothetical protein
MIPAVFNLKLYRGDTASWVFTLWQDRKRTQPVDLTGVEPKSEIRERHGGALILALPLKTTLPNIIEADLSRDDSQKLTRRSAVWDLQLTLGDGTVATVVSGHVFVTPSVTESA